MSSAGNSSHKGRYVELDLALRYTHPLGHLRPYFEGLEEGRALGVRCQSCGRCWFPPRRVCCARSLADSWIELGGAGTVLCVTSGQLAMPFTDLRAAMSLALVAMDGADNAAVGWLADAGTRVAPGTRVRLVTVTGDTAHPVQCARFEPHED